MKGNTVFRYITLLLFLSHSSQPYQLINKKYQFGHLKTGFHNTRNGVTCDNQNMYYYVMLYVIVLKLLRHACLCQNMHSGIRVTDYNQGEKYQNTLLCRDYVDYNTCVYNLRYHYVVTLQAELIQIKQPIVEIVANNTNYVIFISSGLVSPNLIVTVSRMSAGKFFK